MLDSRKSGTPQLLCNDALVWVAAAAMIYGHLPCGMQLANLPTCQLAKLPKCLSAHQLGPPMGHAHAHGVVHPYIDSRGQRRPANTASQSIVAPSKFDKQLPACYLVNRYGTGTGWQKSRISGGWAPTALICTGNFASRCIIRI